MEFGAIETVLISVVVGSVLTWMGHVLSSSLAERRDRKQLIRKWEADRITAVEERAGIVLESIYKHPIGAVADAELNRDLDELRRDVGRLKRFQELSNASRDLEHWSRAVLSEKFKHGDWRACFQNAEVAHATLLEQTKLLLS